MNYIKVSKAAENWGISPRRVRILCAEGKIPGVIRKGKLYMIPENAVKPDDSRLSGSTIYSNLGVQNEHVSKLRPMIEGEVERLHKKVMFEPLYNTNEEETIISAGVTYFYLCGVLEEDNISLNVVDSYRCLPDEFYNRVFSIIANVNESEDIIHMFGVIGAPKKIEKITDVVESGLKENCNRILRGNEIIKLNNNLDYLGNLYFRMVQEFFLEEENHFPFNFIKDNNDWKLNCIWCSNAEEEKSHALADSTIEMWLENEGPIMLGKQLMLRSFFVSDFVNRKLVACFQKNKTSEWQLLFEGGNSIALGSEDFYKGIASPNSFGFFSVSGINSILMNPIYSHGIYLYPDDICLEWHKVFLYLCAISDIEWNINSFKVVYDQFLMFLKKNICFCVDAPPLITQEEGLKVFLIHISDIRGFLKGEDEPVISKDLFHLLNTRYVYLPYLSNLITINTSKVDILSKEWLREKIDTAIETMDTYQKGVLWENVAEYVINHIWGWRITGRRVRAGSQEIDLSIANISLDDELWQLGSYILVECKNWKRHVDIPQIRNIAYISTMKGNKTALLFAANGITEDAAKEIIRLASTGIYILTITADDIKKLKNNDDCRNMILKKFFGLCNKDDLLI